MKAILIIISCILLLFQLKGQQQSLLTQYREVLPLFNPSFSGLEEYSEVNFGFRQQWSGIADAPVVTYASFSGIPKIKAGKRKKNDRDKQVQIPDNGLRMSNPFLHKKFLRDSSRSSFKRMAIKAKSRLKKLIKSQKENVSKHGISGIIISESRGPFKSYAINLGYSYHIHLNDVLKLSAGISGVLANTNFESDKAIVAHPENDKIYQQYLGGKINKNAYFINTGFILYSPRFYFSYALSNVISEGLGSQLTFSSNIIEKQQNIAGGLTIEVNPLIDVIPGFIYFFKSKSPEVYNISTKLFYQKKYWLALNLRNNNTIGASIGLIFNKQYRMSYSYDNPSNEFQGISRGTHEIVFGINISKGSFSSAIIR